MPELRILRHDIRRSFGDMFVNVSYSNEISLMARFIGEIFRPDCLVKLAQPSCNAYKKIVQISFDDKTRNSLESFLDGFAMSCEMMPDQVVRLLECQVRTRQGSLGSIIVLKTLINGVQTLTPDTLRKDPTVHKLQYDEETHLTSSFTFISSPINSKSSEYSLSSLQFPVEIVNTVLFIIILDEKFILRIN